MGYYLVTRRGPMMGAPKANLTVRHLVLKRVGNLEVRLVFCWALEMEHYLDTDLAVPRYKSWDQ